MTTLTPLPKNFPVQTIPYQDPKKKSAPWRKYAIHIKQDGCLPKLGASYTTLEGAMKKAAQASIEYGEACVMDQSQATGQRMIRLFRRGIDYLAR